MDKATARVGVLMGGLSSEREVSLMTGHKVLEGLRERGWNAWPVFIDRNADQAIRAAEITVAWVALHGRYGEDGCVQGQLELAGIPYTGSGVLASALAMDKWRAQRMLGDGSPHFKCPKSRLVLPTSIVEPDDVEFPVIVKPQFGGSSFGVSLVRTGEELQEAFGKARMYSKNILIQQYVDGEEITVSVLNDLPLPVVKIIHGGKIFGTEEKYQKGATYACPADLSTAETANAQCAAQDIYRLFGCRGLARADFMIWGDQLYFLEMNTIPGMTHMSLAPFAAAAVGITYPELCEQILLSATCAEIPAR